MRLVLKSGQSHSGHQVSSRPFSLPLPGTGHSHWSGDIPKWEEMTPAPVAAGLSLRSAAADYDKRGLPEKSAQAFSGSVLQITGIDAAYPVITSSLWISSRDVTLRSSRSFSAIS